ncbi:hypothetical protein BD626DRAFT_569124 [Schizophyllum amplum]|uniref:Uncharacterized protein n=1 Tax=Schizophyllum amplum TaxID=97359 RepID=A0A550CE28_9AGAR|nr:hypothetical protein BD626DRAFT_569124 [Auriculariopsis ampla]
MASIQQAFNAFFPSHHSSAVFLALPLCPRSLSPATHVDLISAYFQLPSDTQFVNTSLSLLHSRTSTLQTPSLSVFGRGPFTCLLPPRPTPVDVPRPSLNARRPRRTSPNPTTDAGDSSRNADGAIDGDLEGPLAWVVIATASSCDDECIDSPTDLSTGASRTVALDLSTSVMPARAGCVSGSTRSSRRPRSLALRVTRSSTIPLTAVIGLCVCGRPCRTFSPGECHSRHPVYHRSRSSLDSLNMPPGPKPPTTNIPSVAHTRIHNFTASSESGPLR